ncbi:MAG: N-acetylglutaminylglutamine synthetase [Gammaproteobacteria bacterium]
MTGHESLSGHYGEHPDENAIVDCGWGRLIFSHTFSDNRKIAEALLQESSDKRDIAFYVSDPHILLAMEPHYLFLDPSHTYRLWLDRYHVSSLRPRGFTIRLLNNKQDAKALHRLYLARQMIPPPMDFIWEKRTSRSVQYFVASDIHSGNILGAATGIDHVEAFNDPEKGASLWALAVDAQATSPGIGQAIVRHMAEFFIGRGRNYLDLSVMHNNKQAIRLYEHLGFERKNVFTVKRKNPFNEPLFIGEQPEGKLNPYAKIITREALRRGISVKVIDADEGFFDLSLGGRSVSCRESLSELTTAVAMSRCDNKAVTRRILHKAGLNVPDQQRFDSIEQAERFLESHRSVVVKPASGEQGHGISVDIKTKDDLKAAIDKAKSFCSEVLLEAYIEGDDVRIIVIDGNVVAAATRMPPCIKGTGQDSIRKLIFKQSRRREAATSGESSIPIDDETERCIADAGYSLDDILPYGEYLTVRKTANLHTGGTIHDITDSLHQKVKEDAITAAAAIDIPVTGLDLIMPKIDGTEYVIIEANERPGLANHEPQPTAERFIDLLFPGTTSN